MKNLFAAVAFSLASVAALALPTTQEVAAAVRQGHYAQAETMMAEVVQADPDSARAHYVYAEILTLNANFPKARAEAARARQLDPAVKFTTPEQFQAVEQLLHSEQIPKARIPAVRLGRGPSSQHASSPRP